VLEGDIRSCFDRLSHAWLLAHIPMDKAILRKWLQAGYLDKHVFHRTEEGTPQGGIISPVLANLALDGLERRLREQYPVTGKGKGKGEKALVNLVRYADDFLITGRSKALLEEEVRPLVSAFLQERGLELSEEKTTITAMEDGFDFLGQNVRKYGGKLLLKPSKKNVQTFLGKIREVIKGNPQVTAYGLLALLNPKIRGWANYHRHSASKATYVQVDWAISLAVWQWAKRRHPNKSKQWVANRYFGRIGGRSGRFFGERRDEHGQIDQKWLSLAAATPIQRHRKIQGRVNPYDPAWELYLEERLGLQMAATLRGRRTLNYLWRTQKGRCPVCEEPITRLTAWHQHHLVWRSKGGSEGVENRVLLHPDCHRQAHANGLSVTKPRP